MEESPAVDVKSLHAALDHAREEKGLSWRQLAKELDVSASTLSRMVNGLKPDVSAFAAMTTWLKMPADSFFRVSPSTDEEPELVVQLAPLLRARRDLDDKDVEYLEELIGGAVRRFRADRSKD
jgi:transcriptional regulator with XRE-family HTH domain